MRVGTVGTTRKDVRRLVYRGQDEFIASVYCSRAISVSLRSKLVDEMKSIRQLHISLSLMLFNF